MFYLPKGLMVVSRVEIRVESEYQFLTKPDIGWFCRNANVITMTDDANVITMTDDAM